MKFIDPHARLRSATIDPDSVSASGCIPKRWQWTKATIDLSGLTFGHLRVQWPSVSARGSQYVTGKRWHCRCTCGNIRDVLQRHLISGRIRSCGCARRKHGLSGMREYKIWGKMVRRCHNSNDSNYIDYGARGIVVCERWRNDAKAFIEDMGPRPSPAHSVDRVNVNGNYEPGNCRWATPAVQRRNQRPQWQVRIDRAKAAHLVEWRRRNPELLRIDGREMSFDALGDELDFGASDLEEFLGRHHAPR